MARWGGIAASVLALALGAGAARSALVDEAGDLRVTGHDRSTGAISLSYTPPGCNESNHNIEYGRLEQVANYAWIGQDCLIGASGTYDKFRPGPNSYFFVVVANDGIDREGSYGTASTGVARPQDSADPVCDFSQVDGDLDGVTAPCDCNDAEPLQFPGNDEICNNLDSDCDGEVDDGIPTDGSGCKDEGPPVFPSTIGTVQIATRTGSGPLDASDFLNVCFCLSNTPGSCTTTCWPLGLDGNPDDTNNAWNERQLGQIDVFTRELVNVTRASVTRIRIEIETSGTTPLDDWTPSCVDLTFDGEKVYCNDDPSVTLGDEPGSVLAWEDLLTTPDPGCTCHDHKLTHGPMVGAVLDDRAKLWIRTDATRQVKLWIAQELQELGRGEPLAYRYPKPATDFTEKIDVLGLVPDTSYFYRFDVGDETGSPHLFRTSAELPGSLRFGFGSCSDRTYYKDWPIFGAIADEDPDLFLFLGDNHYANTGQLDILRQNYRFALERPQLAALLHSTPALATWDDHDFLGNASNGNGLAVNKQRTLRAFNEYWANPAAGCPGSGCSSDYDGVFFTHEVRDVEFFVLDGRFWRGSAIDPATQCPVELQPTVPGGFVSPSLLGPCQTQWLFDRLSASDATFKILVSGSQWSVEGGTDSWAGFDEAQLELLQLIADHEIEGVVALSGDVHRTEFRRLPGGGRFGGSRSETKGYAIPELVSSPLARNNFSCEQTNESLFCVSDGTLPDDFGMPQGLFFTIVDIETAIPDPTLTATIHDIDGPLASWTILRSELENPRTSAVLGKPDFNGDGYADLVIGSPGEDVVANSKTDAGAFHVLYGSGTGLHVYRDQVWSRADPELLGSPEEFAVLASALATGDFNDDGFADLAAGAPGDIVLGLAGAGSVNVIYGSGNGLDASTVADQLWNQDVSHVGLPEAQDRFGSALAVGDFNGDGVDNLAVGVPGQSDERGAAHVFYGSAPGGLGSPASLGEQLLFQHVQETGDHFGQTLSAGDFDGDGKDDLAIGAPDEDSNADNDERAGQVTVFSGSASGLIGVLNLDLDTPGIASATEALDEFGKSLTTGKVNGDAFDDLIVGAPGRDVGSASDAGSAYVFFGSALSGLTTGGSQIWSLASVGVAGGAATGDRFGAALACGDFDGDQIDDLALGTPGRTVSGKSDAGMTFVLYGTTTGLDTVGLQALDQTSAKNATPETDDAFGAAVSAGDFNLDGFLDLVVGSPGQNKPPLTDVGLVNVFYGSADGLVLTVGTNPLALTRPDAQRWHPDMHDVEETNENGDGFGSVLP